MTLFPPHMARRMVLLSDGIQTNGDAMAIARSAAGSGTQIETVNAGGTSSAEALVTAVNVPRHLLQGEHFDLQISLQSNQAMQAGMRVLANDNVVFSGTQNLGKGQESFSLPLVADKIGFTRFQVQLDPARDTFYQNNTLSAFTRVSGTPAILVVAQTASPGVNAVSGSGQEEADQLIRALQASHLNVDRVEPTGMPSDLAGMIPYSSIVLVDIPASALGQKQMQSLQSYVRDLGGGLVVVGGPNSYGPGGYYRTSLETLLPVNMQIKDQSRNPTVSMVFIIDRSGSMDEASGGSSKLELAKETTLRAMELLNPVDKVGVIAFDDSATWVVPMTDLSHLQNIQSAIKDIHSGGGTNLLGGVQAMTAALSNDSAKIKNAILLTDGASDPAGISDLVQQVHDGSGITLTTIGLGQDAASYLAQLAQLGGGQYYFTADPTNIPIIFTKETNAASDSYLVEHSFTPAESSNSPILSGINVKNMPPLLGYVGTTIKENSQSILLSDLGDPILAVWQYGLGRTVAFTSDASGHWAQQWLSWPSFSDFWGQLVRYSTREETPSLLDARIQGQGLTASLLADGQSDKGESLNNYQLQAHITTSDGSTQVLNLVQTAPGQYRSQFDTPLPGVYMINISGTPPQGSLMPVVNSTSGWVLPYSPEYRLAEDDGKLLDQIASVGNGKKLALDASSAGSVFVHNLLGGQINFPIWLWLVGTAIVLLPFDIALRRLLIRPQEMKDRLMLRFGLRQNTEERVHSQRMEALMEVKQRAEKQVQKLGTVHK